jgi:hypothetical protein
LICYKYEKRFELFIKKKECEEIFFIIRKIKIELFLKKKEKKREIEKWGGHYKNLSRFSKTTLTNVIFN